MYLDSVKQESFVQVISPQTKTGMPLSGAKGTFYLALWYFCGLHVDVCAYHVVLLVFVLRQKDEQLADISEKLNFYKKDNSVLDWINEFRIPNKDWHLLIKRSIEYIFL